MSSYVDDCVILAKDEARVKEVQEELRTVFESSPDSIKTLREGSPLQMLGVKVSLNKTPGNATVKITALKKQKKWSERWRQLWRIRHKANTDEHTYEADERRDLTSDEKDRLAKAYNFGNYDDIVKLMSVSDR